MSTRQGLSAASLPNVLDSFYGQLNDIRRLLRDPSVMGVYPSTGMTVGNITIGSVVYGSPQPSQVQSVVVTPGSFFDQVFVDLQWSAPATGQISNYAIAYAKKSNSDGTYGVPTSFYTNLTTWRIQNLAANTTYGFKIWAIAADTKVGLQYPTGTGYQDFTTGQDTTIPAAPSNVSANAGATSILVKWDDNTEPDVTLGNGLYEVQRDTSSTFTSGSAEIRRISGTLMTFIGMPVGVTQYFRVRAIDSSTNTGPWSSVVSAVPGGAVFTSDGSVPPPAGAPTVTGLVGAIFAKWTAVANTDPLTYDVHVGNSSAFTPSSSTLATSTVATSAILKNVNGSNLVNGTTYYVKIVTRDADGSASPSAASAAVTMVLVGNSDITPGSITASLIQAGTITSASGVIGSLDAGAIVTGTLNSNLIAAGSITASKLTISNFGPNIIPNGMLSDITSTGAIDSWTNQGGAPFSWISDNTTSGSFNGLRFASAINPGGSAGSAKMSSNLVAVPAGKTITVAFAVKSTIASTSISVVALFSKNGGSVSTSDAIVNQYAPVMQLNDGTGSQTTLTDSGGATGQLAIVSNLVLPTTNTWYRVRATFNIPKDAAGLTMQCYSNTRATAGTDSISDINAMIPIEGSGITANSISSNNIVTAGLDAGVIKFGVMSGDRITANTLSAGAIKTSTLSAATITIGSGGALLIGTASVNGIQIDSTGMYAWNASAPTLQITSAGAVTVSGTITSSIISGSSIYGSVYYSVAQSNLSSAHLEISSGDATSIAWKYGPFSPAYDNTKPGYEVPVPPSITQNSNGQYPFQIFFPHLPVPHYNDTTGLLDKYSYHQKGQIYYDGWGTANHFVKRFNVFADATPSAAADGYAGSVVFTTIDWTNPNSGLVGQGSNTTQFGVEGFAVSFVNCSLFYVDNIIQSTKGFQVVYPNAPVYIVKDDGSYGIVTDHSAQRIRFNMANTNFFYIDSSGGHNVSTLKNKEFIQSEKISPDLIDQVNFVSYHPKFSTKDRRAMGVIAEEMALVDNLRIYVGFDEEGAPDAVAYDKLAIAMSLSVNAKLNNEIQRLTRTIDSLAARTTGRY